MTMQIYVNPAVKDISRSRAFFMTLGFGSMYGRAFTDLDGHIWEVMWMDEGEETS